MRRALLLAIALPFFACIHAAPTPQLTRKGGDHGLFVGHTSTGVVVVAATHYNAMNGLAVMAGDIEGTDVDDGSSMLCRREQVTGSHYPQWICRYKEDEARISQANRDKARAFLQSLPQACTDGCVSH